MKTVYKHPLLVLEEQSIPLPKGSRILSVQVQGMDGDPMLWALVDPDAESEPRRFWIFGTGHPMTNALADDLEYVDTFQMRNGTLVFHVFASRRSAPEQGDANG